MPFSNACLDTIGVCPNRLYVITVGQNCEDLVQMQLIDPLTGALMDLTQFFINTESSSSSCISSSSNDRDADVDDACIAKTGVEIYMKARYEDINPWAVMQAVIKNEADARNGIIYIPFTPHSTRGAGTFVATAVVSVNGVARKIFPFYIDIPLNLSLFNATGPLSIAEIRMATRDICPAFNFLIDTVEFKDEEIAWAMRRPIDYWNEAQPPLNVIYSSHTFPFRYNWTEATIAILLRTVAMWLRRNDLDYSAGGLTVADTKKWPEYERMANERWQAYKEWVTNKKLEINIAHGFNSIGGYRYNPYR